MEQILKIAMVDDQPLDSVLLAEKIEKYMGSRWLKYELLQYNSGEAFVAAMETVRFDIVFMDIFMDGMTGIEAAGKLRRRDMDCKLVFITSSKDHLEDGYAFNPSHYLVKPFTDNRFDQAMENCRIKRQLEVPYLDIISNGAPLRIDTTELIYVDTYERNVLLHTISGILPAGRGFSGISELLLRDERFFVCIRGVLVNMDFIHSVEDSVFFMKNGDRLQMALREKKNLILKYRDYQFAQASHRGGPANEKSS